jgi:hypothetical protein
MRPIRALASRPWLTILAVVLMMAMVLLAMGRVPICRCGAVKLWHGVVYSSENSQHLSDWYSFTHVVHGFLFFGLLWLAGRRWSFGTRIVLATVVESGWEILENTPLIINRYRAVTISLDYFGDSVINSISDVGAMLVGFIIAARVPWWVSVLVVIGFEMFLAIAIRDNLAINILMLLYPLEAVKRWQSG